jgi:hypothetical protein
MLSSQNRIIWVRSAQLVAGLLLIIAALGIYSNYQLLNAGIATALAVLALLAFIMRYWRIGYGALFLALVFSTTLPFHFSRNVWVVIDLLSLALVVYFTYWATNPNQKGNRFERYVLTLFPEKDFIVEDSTCDASKFLGRHVESDTHPDFILRERKSGKSFAVECKWRGNWIQGKGPEPGLWWNLKQGSRYLAFQESARIPVYVVFGIGGTPDKPKEIYFLPASELKWAFLKQSLIRSGRSVVEMTSSV